MNKEKIKRSWEKMKKFLCHTAGKEKVNLPKKRAEEAPMTFRR